MTYRFAWPLLTLVALCVGLLATTGCKKESATGSAGTETYQNLPEATNVIAALQQKDYETAVSGLAKLKESVSTPEQQAEYRTLLTRVQTEVGEAVGKDPKATEAMQALRIMITGR